MLTDLAVRLAAAGVAMWLVGAAVGAEGTALRRSEVVFMGPKDPEIYRAYGATMVSWGGHAWKNDPAAIADFVKKRVEPAHALGMRYCTGLAFRTAFARMIDFDENFMQSVTRDLDGNPITVPWLWDHKHKGHPAYWFCTNAPGYRKFLRDQTRRAVVGDPEGLHIDDYAGTSGCPGGCFCPYCMKAFTEYLKQHAKPEELKREGIDSLEGFDYATFLRAKGITAEQVRKKRWTVPLNGLYETFQIKASRDFVAEIKQYAEQLRGGPLLLSVNSSGTSAPSLVIAPVIDYFCGEVGHHASEEKVPNEPIFAYKMADALGKRVACTASGWDWAFVAEKHRPGLVRTWIAQSYAFGHSLMAPHRQWAYTKEKGTHWYQSQPGDYAYLYQFVRHNAELFDGYDAVESVAVLYSSPAFRRWKRGAMQACGWLAEHNVPFGMALAGDDWLDARLTPESLKRWKAVVVPEPTYLQGPQQEALAAAQDRLVAWPEKASDEAGVAAALQRLEELYPPQIRVTGAQNVLVVARAKTGEARAPAICHLLNRNYEAVGDDVVPQQGLQVELAADVFGGRKFSRATLYAPQAEPQTLKVRPTDRGVKVAVPRLGLWGVLRLD